MRLAALPAWIALILGLPAVAHAADPAPPASPADPIDPAAAHPAPASVSFDADFFPAGMAPKVDLSRFEKGNAVLPGDYYGDIRLNMRWRARGDITFANSPGSDEAQPCFDAAMLTSYGVDLKKVAADATAKGKLPIPQGRFCAPLGDYIPGASTQFDIGTQNLSISVPQIYESRNAQGYVDPSQWDAGINAAVFAYNANLYRSGNGRQETSGYLGLNASMNFGSWHVAHQGAANWREHGGLSYQRSATYLQHDIPSWQAQVVAGDTFTSGDMFDSVRLRGIRLYTDDGMLPQSLRGFAPVVRGIAETNAHVIVRQNGYVIYDVNVAPGAFAFDDLYPTGYGGDLNVEVQEADGRIKRFVVPFSAVPQLLRPGQQRWSVSAGKVEQRNQVNTPNLLQATYQRGLTNRVTGYGGVTLGDGYRAALVGAGLNTAIGAFSSDLTQARNQVPGARATQGLSTRVAFNKNIVQTGTNFGVAAYRYSTGGYVGLNDAVTMRTWAARGEGSLLSRQRSRMDVNINQNLPGNNGQVFLTGSSINYWNQRGRQVDFTAGYSGSWKSLSYSFSAQRTRDSLDASGLFGNTLVNRIPGDVTPVARLPALQTRRDTRLFLTISMPLGRAENAPLMTALASHSPRDGGNEQVTVGGVYGAERRLSYSGTLSHAAGANNAAVSGQYNGSFGNIGASYSRGSNYTQLGASMSGSLVVYRGSAVFSPPTGDTIGLVYAPGGRGARIEGGQGSVLDINGYGVVPYLQPYQLNTVALDPKDASAGLELKSSQLDVAPRSNSVVLIKFDSRTGRALLVETSLPDGRPIPFGADVLDEKGGNIGIAGQASRLYIRDMPSSGMVTVQWGDSESDSCQIDLHLKPRDKDAHMDMEKIQAPCILKVSASTPQANSPVASPVAALSQSNRSVQSGGVAEYAPLQSKHISHGLTARDAI
ncbi:usher CupB3 [Dyella sp. GSA-30]|nr:usher CupB3 [Dyella sp. GSA-30]